MELWDILDANGNKTGGTIKRGAPFKEGEYHLVADVWILNAAGEFLITRRVPDKDYEPGKWAPTCGCAVAGDDSLTTALKEAREETGIRLGANNGEFIKRFTVSGDTIVDVWLFRQEVNIDRVILQPGETDAAIWAGKDTIRRLINNGDFIREGRVPYLEELFDIC